MKHPCSGVILAGGLNLRFSGENKALLSVGGKRILDRIYDVFTRIFDDIILVTNDPLPYVKWDLSIVTDVFQVRSPLAGIHAGLFHMSSDHAFVIACDTPFLKGSLIEDLVGQIDARKDVIIPETPDGLQPLFSVYARQCLQPLERHLSQQKPAHNRRRVLQPSLKVQRFLESVRVKKVPGTVLREKDPDLVSFFNINQPEDLVRAEAMATEIDAGSTA
jgi:molybdopterin-guanine dinucleotide biosynthesis protein A